MEIKPTIVQVKDIIVLDDTNYGDHVVIQIVGTENATAPLSVPADVLKAFTERINGGTMGAIITPMPEDTALEAESVKEVVS